MSRIKGSPNRKAGRKLAQVGLLTAIPTILAVAPLIGYFLGRWADRALGTDPYLMVTGIVLGFAAAAREISNLLRKAERFNRDDQGDD